jgi:Spy/CpxP family protein refolding chaperone
MKSLNLSFLLAPGLLALGLASGLPLAAQTPDQQSNTPQAAQSAPRTPDPVRQSKHLAKRLNLTPDQENQIEPILADRIQQSQAIRSDATLSPKDRAAKMRTLRQDSEAKIKSVLTSDQQQKYDQMRQQEHDRMMQHRQEHQQTAPSA